MKRAAMHPKTAFVATVLLGSSLTAFAQEAPRYEVGKAISTQLMLRLTDPGHSAHRIGVVHQQLATGMLLPSPSSSTPIEFLRGVEYFLWGEAARQAQERPSEQPIRLAVERRSIDLAACPQLASQLQQFSHELEMVMSRPVSLSEPAPPKHRWTDAEGQEGIIVDAPAFWIQISLADATIIITPDGGSDPPLQRAALKLHSIVSGCSNSVAPKIEEHDF
jgi:hypothetical protein